MAEDPYKGLIVTPDYLDNHPNVIFVFGDNLIRKGVGGAAALRWHEQTYGFITKKYPDCRASSYYTPEEYRPVFAEELYKLERIIKANPDKIYLISKLGGRLANKYRIYEKVISAGLIRLVDKYLNAHLVY